MNYSKEKIVSVIGDLVAQHMGMRVLPDDPITNQGADSLDLVEIAMKIEDFFSIELKDSRLQNLDWTINSLVDYTHEILTA